MQPKPTHHLFIDETGDHGLTYVDVNYPIFLLVGCLISERSLLDLERLVRAVKTAIFVSDDVILHSRDIRKCEGPFQVLFNLDIKKCFYESINRIMGDGDFAIFAVGIDKKRYIDQWGLSGEDPYAFCFTQMMNNLATTLDSVRATAGIIPEMRGGREDARLMSHYNRMMDVGSGIVSAEVFGRCLTGMSLRPKRDNVIGLQIADLCAYALGRHLIRPNEPYPPYGVVADKIIVKPGAICDSCGFEVFPQKTKQEVLSDPLPTGDTPIHD